MSKDTTQDSPRKNKADEFDALKEQISKHGPVAAIAVCIIIGAIAGSQWYRERGVKDERVAQANLVRGVIGGSIGDLQAVSVEQSGTDLGALALIALAKQQYNSGDAASALGSYDEFLNAYPAHEFAPVAQLGRLHCLEGLGNTDQALAGFTAFTTDHPDHFAAPQAVFGKARCLAASGKSEEARQVYEDFISSDRYAGSGWLQLAEQYLQNLKQDMNRRVAPVAAPAIPDSIMPVPSPLLTPIEPQGTTETNAVQGEPGQ